MANGEIYEKNLSNASGIGSGDYLRTVNSNNESEKINYTLLAKAIVEQWTGSTLAGSAQSVKSALYSLNSKTTYKSFSLADYFTRNTSTTSDASGRIMNFGNCVTIVGQVGGVAVTSSGGVVIGSLTKYAPSAYEVHCVGMIGTGSNGGTPVRLNVATNGNITVYGTTSTNATIRFSVSYITSNV